MAIAKVVTIKPSGLAKKSNVENAITGATYSDANYTWSDPILTYSDSTGEKYYVAQKTRATSEKPVMAKRNDNFTIPSIYLYAGMSMGLLLSLTYSSTTSYR